MKNTVSTSILFLIAFLISAAFVPKVTGTKIESPQAADQGAIPANLKPFFENSCKPCHFKGGKFKTLYKVNFTKWDDYGSKKQAEKARKICSVLSDESMPPEMARKFNPKIIPTKEQVDAVCKWSASLQTGTGK
jgi:hypothetical protein